MILSFKKLPAETFNQYFLIDRIYVEQHDQRDQPKNSLGQFYFEKRFAAGQERGQGKRNHRKGKKKDDENGVTAHPPIAFFDPPAFVGEFLCGNFCGCGCSVEPGWVAHSVRACGTTKLYLLTLGRECLGVKADSKRDCMAVTAPGRDTSYFSR